ncbi:MAG: hypothetical protein NTW21_32610 [Verrucomicrobia bacterium]|nr:hypothetical protein [Verrucomicrobiota bacterium]
MTFPVLLNSKSTVLGPALIALSSVSDMVNTDHSEIDQPSGRNYSASFEVDQVLEEVDADHAEETLCNPIIRAPIWDHDAQMRFEDLAEKFAMEEITPFENEELKRLQQIRAFDLPPRTYEEVKREFEIESAAAEAIRAIDHLISSVSKPWRVKA